VTFEMNGKAGDKDKGFLVWEGSIEVANESYHGLRCQASNSA